MTNASDGQIGVGEVDFGDLRRLVPVSTEWGFDRGRPVDRYYIEGFLARHASDIRGRTLEIDTDAYTKRFGGDRVARSDVMNFAADTPGTTIVGDISSAPHIPSNTFDCIIFTQTLQLVFNVQGAIHTLHRILRPGGVLLATFPGISHSADQRWSGNWCWNFTSVSARLLFEAHFEPGRLNVEAHGNVLAAISFLQGLAAEELRPDELDYRDPGYEVLIAVRAEKAASEPGL